MGTAGTGRTVDRMEAAAHRLRFTTIRCAREPRPRSRGPRCTCPTRAGEPKPVVRRNGCALHLKRKDALLLSDLSIAADGASPHLSWIGPLFRSRSSDHVSNCPAFGYDSVSCRPAPVPVDDLDAWRSSVPSLSGGNTLLVDPAYAFHRAVCGAQGPRIECHVCQASSSCGDCRSPRGSQ